MRAWWQRHHGKPADDRPFQQQPLATLLAGYFRHCADRLAILDEKAQRDIEDMKEAEQLRRVLDPVEEKAPTLLEAVDTKWTGKRTTSDDPVWDRYVAMIEAGETPDQLKGKIHT